MKRSTWGTNSATRFIPRGSPVKKFGQTIGFASCDIAPGSWVHTHNVEVGPLSLDYAYASEIPPDPEPITGRTFPGYRRHDGRAATRNYIAVISTVNCSAYTSRLIAQKFDRALLEKFPNVDGIIPLVHKHGCAMQYGGEDHQQLNRTLAGFARHVNIGAYLIVGLGCETGQASFLADSEHLVQIDVPGRARRFDAPGLEHAGRRRDPEDGDAAAQRSWPTCCPRRTKSAVSRSPCRN